ncbi:hypothetical protein K435DRAFT_843815 [Dendrothele bispora CBS 962.96]|uniref:Uncharacterized protein n=1 Tax=Dendrothele bispora (strain CBS 962.96) TaxID=1314807 RepID=A0A4S8L6Q3_DENBC|nr:hypothetical protein K435DRAFT_843815 [Dendrothele bispora CBS 962.96]
MSSMPPPPPWQKVQNGEKTDASGGSITNVNATNSSFIGLNPNDAVKNAQRDAYRLVYSRDSARSFSNYSGSNHHHQNLQNGRTQQAQTQQAQRAEQGTQRQYDASLVSHDSSESLRRSAVGLMPVQVWTPVPSFRPTANQVAEAAPPGAYSPNTYGRNLQNGPQAQQAEPGTQRQYDASLINRDSSEPLQRSAVGLIPVQAWLPSSRFRPTANQVPAAAPLGAYSPNIYGRNLQNGQAQQAEPGTQRQYDASLVNHDCSEPSQRSVVRRPIQAWLPSESRPTANQVAAAAPPAYSPNAYGRPIDMTPTMNSNSYPPNAYPGAMSSARRVYAPSQSCPNSYPPNAHPGMSNDTVYNQLQIRSTPIMTSTSDNIMLTRTIMVPTRGTVCNQSVRIDWSNGASSIKIPLLTPPTPTIQPHSNPSYPHAQGHQIQQIQHRLQSSPNSSRQYDYRHLGPPPTPNLVATQQFELQRWRHYGTIDPVQTDTANFIPSSSSPSNPSCCSSSLAKGLGTASLLTNFRPLSSSSTSYTVSPLRVTNISRTCLTSTSTTSSSPSIRPFASPLLPPPSLVPKQTQNVNQAADPHKYFAAPPQIAKLLHIAFLNMIVAFSSSSPSMYQYQNPNVLPSMGPASSSSSYFKTEEERQNILYHFDRLVHQWASVASFCTYADVPDTPLRVLKLPPIHPYLSATEVVSPSSSSADRDSNHDQAAASPKEGGGATKDWGVVVLIPTSVTKSTYRVVSKDELIQILGGLMKGLCMHGSPGSVSSKSYSPDQRNSTDTTPTSMSPCTNYRDSMDGVVKIKQDTPTSIPAPNSRNNHIKTVTVKIKTEEEEAPLPPPELSDASVVRSNNYGFRGREPKMSASAPAPAPVSVLRANVSRGSRCRSSALLPNGRHVLMQEPAVSAVMATPIPSRPMPSIRELTDGMVKREPVPAVAVKSSPVHHAVACPSSTEESEDKKDHVVQQDAKEELCDDAMKDGVTTSAVPLLPIPSTRTNKRQRPLRDIGNYEEEQEGSTSTSQPEELRNSTAGHRDSHTAVGGVGGGRASKRPRLTLSLPAADLDHVHDASKVDEHMEDGGEAETTMKSVSPQEAVLKHLARDVLRALGKTD